MTPETLTLYAPHPKGGYIFVGRLQPRAQGAWLSYPTIDGVRHTWVEGDAPLVWIRGSAELLRVRDLHAYYRGRLYYEVHLPESPVGK
jgi:hypothetical protein